MRPSPFEIELDRSAGEVYLDGIPFSLEAGEYALLCQFADYTRRKERPTIANLTELMRKYHVAD